MWRVSVEAVRAPASWAGRQRQKGKRVCAVRSLNFTHTRALFLCCATPASPRRAPRARRSTTLVRHTHPAAQCAPPPPRRAEASCHSAHAWLKTCSPSRRPPSTTSGFLMRWRCVRVEVEGRVWARSARVRAGGFRSQWRANRKHPAPAAPGRAGLCEGTGVSPDTRAVERPWARAVRTAVPPHTLFNTHPSLLLPHTLPQRLTESALEAYCCGWTEDDARRELARACARVDGAPRLDASSALVSLVWLTAEATKEATRAADVAVRWSKGEWRKGGGRGKGATGLLQKHSPTLSLAQPPPSPPPPPPPGPASSPSSWGRPWGTGGGRGTLWTGWPLNWPSPQTPLPLLLLMWLNWRGWCTPRWRQ